jgi:trimeric autotransporter adhesin
MKKSFVLFVCMLSASLLFAQAPAKFNYQGIARNADGSPMAGRTINLRLSILEGNNGEAVYTETNTAVTNTYGLYTVAVGGGKSQLGAMNKIIWGTGEKYIKVEIDPAGGSNYVTIGNAQLLSVPFALYAASGPGKNNSGKEEELYWKLLGNGGTDPGVNFLGTTDNTKLVIKTNNTLSGFLDPNNDNVALGTQALSNNPGSNMVAIGDGALYNQTTNGYGQYGNTAIGSKGLFSNTTGIDNTATGYRSLFSNTTGNFNTANGFKTLYNNTTGEGNTAVGDESLLANTTGAYNTSIGLFSLAGNTTGYYNSAIGANALYSNTSGGFNTASGWSSLYSNTTGTNNTATGWAALYSNSTGNENTATGYGTLYSNTTGYYNTVNGSGAMYYNTTGYSNVANGAYALYRNTFGRYNTATGSNSLYTNTTGYNNTASGCNSLNYNTTGYNNTVSGALAMYNNTIGDNNTATGSTALYSNTQGYYNAANGVNALYANTTGAANSALGYNALYSNTTGILNTAVGYYSLYNNTTGNYNTVIGYYANVGSGNLSNATALGYGATVYANNSVIVGNTGVTSIGGQVSWTSFSDGRYKNNIREDVHGLDFILQLKPLTYNFDRNKLSARNGYVKDAATQKMEQQAGIKAPTEIRYSGFIAQDVEKAAQKVGYEFSGVDKPADEKGTYGLRYAEFVVPLIKAVQEQQAMINTLKKEVEELKSLNKQITINQ